jgi:DNA-binding phage protein
MWIRWSYSSVDLQINGQHHLLMNKSTRSLATTLNRLRRQARARGLSDSAWASLAGIRKETLSRLRERENCDFETMCLLADAVGARLGVLEVAPDEVTPDGHFPVRIDREYEERLVELCASGDRSPIRWQSAGPRFFMAGLAVMLAGSERVDRPALLALAEELHPGATEVVVFSRWLERSPVRPSRFLPLIEARSVRAA